MNFPDLSDLPGVRDQIPRAPEPMATIQEPYRLAHLLRAMVTTARGVRGLPPSISTSQDGAHALPAMVTSAPGSDPLASLHAMVTPSASQQPGASQQPSMSLLDAHGQQDAAPSGAGQPPMQNPIQPNALSGVAAPQALPLPQVKPQQKPSLMARIGHALMSAGSVLPDALGAAEDKFSDAIRPSAPQGYDGLGLSQDEIKSARPSLLHSLIGGEHALSSDQQYAANLDGLIQRKQMSVAMQRQQDIVKARRDMMTKFPMPTSGSEADLSKWANSVMPFLMQSGDYEGVKTLQPLVDTFAKQHAKTFQPELFKGPNGEMRFFSPDEQTQVPQGWQPVQKAGASGLGTPQLFRGPKGDYIGVAPGDNETLSRISKQGYKPEVTARTEFVQGNVQDRADATAARGDVKSFMTNTKPLRDRAAVIDQAIRTIDDAAHNPDARVRKTLYSSAVANFVQAADQKAQIRYQLLNYFKDNVDPSIAGKWSLLKARLLDGSLPQYTMEGMLKHLQNLHEMTQTEFEAQRNGLLKRKPELEGALPETEEFFPNFTPPNAATAAPTAPSKSTGYSPNNPFAGKK